MKKGWKITLAAAGFLVCLWVLFGRMLVFHFVQSRFLSTGPNGPQTPSSVGIPYERIKFASGDRRLDGYLVRVSGNHQPRAALLIFHGRGETISDWVQAQRVLYEHGISSLVFDYSGHGDSTSPGTIRNLNADAIAAYGYFAWKFKDDRKCVLGFSMGNAPMLASMKRFQPAPACVIVASAFSSLRELTAKYGKSRPFLRLLVRLLPDVWNNVKAVADNRAPLLVLHSTSDTANPFFMGERIFQAAHKPKQLVALRGFMHNAPLDDASGGWWDPVIRFVTEQAGM